MNDDSRGRDRDLVLAPGESAFVLDTTKGLINTVVGPHKTSMSNTDQPVVWDKDKRRFRRVDADAAIQVNPVAPEGFYIALYNPADGTADKEHPREGSSISTPSLRVGHRVNIPGPVTFPLWPGQFAEVIRGHHLRSNQYLLCQVYNDQEASDNWSRAILKTVEGATDAPNPRTFTPGQLLIIKGTDVSFFIPPTGIKVVSDTLSDLVSNTRRGGGVTFVRDAVTLERLEYCILLGENGSKRFVQGPAVVFPEPTEKFVEKDGSRKFRAIELNENTGIYVKVIADYVEGEGESRKEYKVGDELFITGKDQPIYFQREEHSIIRYDDRTKHYAVAIPTGEGRYVLNRITGEVKLVRGPQMLLCDPRREVVVRRILDEQTVKLWYPGNARAVEVNRDLQAKTRDRDDASAYDATRPVAAMALYSTATADAVPLSSTVAGDKFQRGSTFTPPRTVTLDTKYEGAVAVSPWSGYAVMVTNKTGKRTVVLGPETVLLEYDESLAPMELSTGTPKTDDKLLNTVYLRVQNNKIGDRIDVETQDLVRVDLTVSYRVNFEGVDQERWFSVENYVRLLCDHMRSLIRNTAKRYGIAEFYGNAIDIVREAILGAESVGATRPGRLFTENNMRVYDVEVLNATIKDASVSKLLGEAQSDTLTTMLRSAKEERQLAYTQRSEDIKRQMLHAVAATATTQSELDRQKLNESKDVETLRANADTEVQRLRDALAKEINTQEIARVEERQAQQAADTRRGIEIVLEQERAHTEEVVKRAGAVTDKLAVALTTAADQALIEKISESLAPLSAMSGVSQAEILAGLFKGTPFESVMKGLATRARIQVPTS